MATQSAANRGVKAALKRVVQTASTSSAAAAAKDLQGLCALISPDQGEVAVSDPELESALRSALDGGIIDALAHHLRSGSPELIRHVQHVIDVWPREQGLNVVLVKRHPGTLQAIARYLDSTSSDLQAAAIDVAASLARHSNTVGRAAADAQMTPKLINLLRTGSSESVRAGAAIALAHMLGTSGKRAMEAARAGVLHTLAPLASSSSSPINFARDKTLQAGAAAAIVMTLSHLPPEHWPEGDTFKQLVVAMTRVMRSDRQVACTAAGVVAAMVSHPSTRQQQAKQQQLYDALDEARTILQAGLPVLKLVKQQASSDASTTSITSAGASSASAEASAATSVGSTLALQDSDILFCCAHGALEAMLRDETHKQSYAVLCEGAGIVELAVQHIRQRGPQDTLFLNVLSLLLRSQEARSRAARAGAAGGVSALLRLAQAQQKASIDDMVLCCVQIIIFCRDASSEQQQQWVSEAFAEGVVQVLSRCQARQPLIAEMLALVLVEPAVSEAGSRPGAQVALEQQLLAAALVAVMQRSDSSTVVEVACTALQRLIAKGSSCYWLGQAALEAGAVGALQRAADMVGKPLPGPMQWLVEQGTAAGQGTHGAAESSASGSSSSSSRGAGSMHGGSGGASSSVGTPVAEATGTANRCGACGASSKPNGKALMQCSACQCEWYCSAACQRKHWKVHKKGCVSREV